MKRIAAFLCLALASAASYAFDISQIQYMQAQIPSSRAVVRLSTLSEFITLVQSNGARLLYRVDTNTSHPMFAFVSDGAVYEVPTSGFDTLVDVRKASAMGLTTGPELQVAEKFATSDRNSFLYVNGQFFSSPKDYGTAMKEGFHVSASQFDVLTLPPSLSAAKFKDVVLRHLAWYILAAKTNGRKPFEVRRDAYGRGTYAERNGETLSNLLAKAQVSPERSWTWADYDTGVNKALEYKDFADWLTKRFSTYSKMPDGTLKDTNSYPRRIDYLSVLSSIKGQERGGSGAPQTGLGTTASPTFDPGALVVPQAPTDSLVFDLARLSGVSSVAEYKAINDARIAGYLTPEDQKAAPQGGFTNTHAFYAARKLGLSKYVDYQIASDARIEDPGIAARYLSLVGDLKKTKDKYETKDASELELAYGLMQLPASVPYGIYGIVNVLRELESRYFQSRNGVHNLFRHATIYVSGYPNLRSPVSSRSDELTYTDKNLSVTVAWVKQTLGTAPWVSRIGDFDARTMTFKRR